MMLKALGFYFKLNISLDIHRFPRYCAVRSY